MNQKEFALKYLAEHGETAGDALHLALDREGHHNSTVGFYGVMARLETSGLVAGDRRLVTVSGMPMRKVFYSITQNGREVVSA